jgi:hypothetical protein
MSGSGGQNVPGNPHECRRQAWRCWQYAEAAPSAEGRKRFEELARMWMALATDLDAAHALLAEWGDDPCAQGEKKDLAGSPHPSETDQAKSGATDGAASVLGIAMRSGFSSD